MNVMSKIATRISLEIANLIAGILIGFGIYSVIWEVITRLYDLGPLFYSLMDYRHEVSIVVASISAHEIYKLLCLRTDEKVVQLYGR